MIDELHADYEVWCFGKGLHATARDDFTNEFDRVREVPQFSGKIRMFGNRYYGIRLVNSNRKTAGAERVDVMHEGDEVVTLFLVQTASEEKIPDTRLR